MAGLVLLRTSPWVAPGQLTAAAWRLLRAASVVLSLPDHPQLAALAAEGIRVQVEQERAPSDLAVLLTERAASETATVWLCDPTGDAELRTALGSDAVVEYGSVDVPGARILELVAVMDRLRSPGGCPWDAAQTHESLVPYLLEEAYETVEAVETGDRASMREELGDVLLQVVFHARLAQEHPTDAWDVDDVASDITEKLVRRHPHVFADGSADTAAEVEASWEALKRVEKGRTSAVDGVPLAQPALALAAKLMSRAEKAGLEVPLPAVAELNPENPKPEGRSEDEPPNPQLRSEDEIGDLLLRVVALARASGVDAEAALRSAARRYALAIRAAESSP